DMTGAILGAQRPTHMRPPQVPGVYYEAGFAQGLGKPVIWTVREDCLRDVHFDTRQFNHICWTDPLDLRHKLMLRIQNTVGQGPVPPPEQNFGS
ncbi:MAG: hypothetical protein ACOYOB_20860, partial [Myxococcota bacterium]